jgi:5-methylcytosine-specific restriction endonuclease McrA
LENDNNIQNIYENALNRIYDNPKLLVMALNGINSELYEKYVRDYKKEYRNYHGKPKQRKDRSKRTTVREKFIKKGIIKKGSKKDIDHKVPLRNGGSNKLNNLRLRDRSENRSDNGHSKGEKQNKDWK